MRTPKKPVSTFTDLVVTWEDGSTSRGPAADGVRQLMIQYAAMVNLDDPDMRLAGLAGLKRIAGDSLTGQLAPAVRSKNASTSAKFPRPGAKKPLTDAILAVMKAGKRDGLAFKVFLCNWEENSKTGETINGLKLRELDDEITYEISDENAPKDSTGKYLFSTLKTLYSKCK